MTITRLNKTVLPQTQGEIAPKNIPQAPENYKELQLNDGNGKNPTSIFYNPNNKAPEVNCDKNNMCTIKGNTDGLFIEAADNGSNLKIENGNNVQFTSYGGTNNIIFENCNNTKAYGSSSAVDNFTYIDGNKNDNYNMSQKDDSLINEKSGFFSGYSKDLNVNIIDY